MVSAVYRAGHEIEGDVPTESATSWLILVPTEVIHVLSSKLL